MNIPKVLEGASEGLFFPSETDAPFGVFVCEGKTVDEWAPTKDVEVVSLVDFFANAMRSEEWHNAEESKQAGDFRALVQIVQILIPDAKVFCVGTRHKDCYIAGTVGNDVAGLVTCVVET